jgi:CBS domain-containing protein
MAADITATPLLALDCVAIDTETTGLDAREARVVQIGAVRVAAGKLVEGGEGRFETLVDPRRPIPPATIAVHHITDAMVSGAPTFAEAAPKLAAFTEGAVWLGHTLDYDLAVLAREHALAGLARPRVRGLDVRLLAEIVAPTLADHGLDRLAEWLGIQIHGRHTALGDADATARIFLALLPALRERGVRTFAEAEAACRDLAERRARTSGGLMATAGAPGGDATADPVTVLSRIDSFPYRHRVVDVMSTPVATAEASTTVREGLALILARRISSLLVQRGEGPGIVTERDMLREIDRDPIAGLATPLGAIARGPLQTVAADDFVYRAIGRMERLGIRHLFATDEAGAIVGAVTTRNLLRHRATTAIVLGDEIDRATSAAELATAWGKLVPMAKSLLSEAVEARTICRVVSAEICAMTRRAAELAEASLAAEGKGAPPVPYAVLVLGSAGRGESQLAADQDNAIVYARGGEGGPEDAWFEQLAIRMCDTLDAAGVPNCKGGVMARNRAWRMSVDDWFTTIDGWVRRQRPEDLLNVDIFFDAAAVSGDAALAERVLGHARRQAEQAVDFLKLLTEIARQRPPAFTLLGSFKVDEKGRIDLKRVGLMPIFTAARVLALRHGVPARSTVDRLRGIEAKGIGSTTIVDRIMAAHGVILATILGQQLRDAAAGVPLSPRVVASSLSKAERGALSSALGHVAEATGLVSEGRL